MSARIAIVNYGMGNLRSVEKALEHVGAAASITSDPAEASAADGIVLPGVGAFPRAMTRLRELDLEEPVVEAARAGVPLLGICLGMQLLFESSTELGGARGLGLLPGDVSRLEAGELKVPHIGWTPVRWERQTRLTAGITSETPFYLVHSFAARPAAGDLLGTALYGERFACAVERENIFGVQFHPEKSSADGLRLLANFAAACVKAPAAA